MFPLIRNRRLRKSASSRLLVAENSLLPSDFIWPLFVVEGKSIQQEIPSMQGIYRLSLDLIVKEVKEVYHLGIRAVLVFVKVEDHLKDNFGKEALNPNGLMQRAIQAIKEACPEMVVFTDVALDPYSIYGHDGVVENKTIANDITCEVLAQMAVSHAKSGADVVAPSDMMDGRILSIRKALEEEKFIDTAIMSYSAKYASAFYGPFRDALDSAPGFGDKKTYQMDPCNAKESLLEIELDLKQGADIVMVKPGMPYLDIIKMASDNFNAPIAAYQVSGEFAMLNLAISKGYLNREDAVWESLIGFKRAGAKLIASYFAKEFCEKFA
ncbi:MAG: porphobilinogen synthase [Flavobacteriaceae bacterium]|nr:MAG: porphobilinogen synthase [Flavobacteriaceae bacterium]